MQTEQELNRYGDPIFTTGKSHQGALLLQLLTRFASDFGGSIDGRASGEMTKQLYIFTFLFDLRKKTCFCQLNSSMFIKKIDAVGLKFIIFSPISFHRC